MIKNRFLAISSDFRSLYKGDVYRLFAKPNGAIEHFRYQDKWLEADPDCKKRGSLINQEVILIFKHVKEGEESKYFPIRKAVIIDFHCDPDTGIYHYYFSLGDFCRLTSSQNIKDNIFFLKDNTSSYEVESWKNVVELIKPYFSDNFFYKINGVVDEKRQQIQLHHDPINHSYFYKFIHGRSYTLEISVANPNSSSQTLTIKSSSTDINVVLTDRYYISAPYDVLKIPITTKSLESFKERSFLSFYIYSEENEVLKEYENHIHISKEMDGWKPFGFGALSSTLIACTWLIKDKTDSIANLFNFQADIDWAAVLYIIMILGSSSLLYALFNKK